jgi:hypothetical protein
MCPIPGGPALKISHGNGWGNDEKKALATGPPMRAGCEKKEEGEKMDGAASRNSGEPYR